MFEGFLKQPESYSDVLNRVFWATFFVGLACTAILAALSPEVKTVITLIKTEVDVSPVKLPDLLAITIPFVVALFSRIIKLHDRVSDVLKIRAKFDRDYIIIPMARAVGFAVQPLLHRPRKQHKDLMNDIFYAFAGYAEPVIDIHLIRTALDQWAWVWVLVEASVVTFIAGIVAIFTVSAISAFIFFLVAVVLLGLAIVIILVSCRPIARREVEAIVKCANRRAAILGVFNAL